MRVCIFSLDPNINRIDIGAGKERTLVEERLLSLAAEAGEIAVITPDWRGGKLLQFFRMWIRARRIFREKKFDLISVQDTAYLALLAFVLARQFKIPFEAQVHGFEKFFGLRKIIAGFVLRRADKIRAVSERLKKLLESRFKIHESRIYELPVYAQVATPSHLNSFGVLPLRKGRDEEKSDFVFLMVGRLVTIKNISLAINAFVKIAKEFPDARLQIVGSGPELHNLMAQVKRLSLGERVSFEGKQENTSDFYQNADAFLFTSDAEGWGIAVIEAAAHGLPIIMTDVGCAGEFIKNGENGIVIPVGDERALVEAMYRLITDEQMRVRFGTSACASFLKLPSASEQIKKQVSEWKDIILCV
jgi:glycosyltransferase involved in cell wall biosynthesis